MSEYNPIDNLSENDSYIIRHQFTNENNGFYAEDIIPNEMNNYSSSLKETKDQITLIDQNLIGNKRQTTDNIELINGDGIEEIESDNNKGRSNEKDSDNDACEQKTKKNRKKRRKFEKDLISMKIQCHYMTFMIKLINEILDFLKYDKRDRFRDIQHSIKKDIKKEHFNQLKGQKLYEVITKKVSVKNRKNNYDEFFNLNLYKKLENDELIKNILNENYLNLFRKIYYKSERNLNLKEYGKDIDISLSEKIEMYRDIKESDEEYINSLDKYVNKMYFSKNKFKIEKNDK
jgi:hypothetical protein